MFVEQQPIYHSPVDPKQQLLTFVHPTTVKKYSSDLSLSKKSSQILLNLPSEKSDAIRRIVERCSRLPQKQGIYSVVQMDAAGFYYTGKEDTARCDKCELEVSGWTVNMDPFTIHAQRSPKCPYVRSIRPDEIITMPIKVNLQSSTSLFNDNEQPYKRQKTEGTQEISQPNILILNEVEIAKQIRKRTFSQWPHRASPSSAQMIEAGFFNCNVGDRVICIYCNIICQQWTSHVDDPWDVHKTLSPKCPYVISTLKRQETSAIRIVNELSTRDNSIATASNDLFRSNEIVYTAACHTAYIEIPKRHDSFATWPSENMPSVDNLVRAGFFYTGTKTIVTCFYCNGSLQNWGANDNPTIEHARWFPHCAYAKQLCGAELYRKIQESKRAQQERARGNESTRAAGNGDNNSGRGQLNIPDESTLSRYVAARLDLPVSQSLLQRKFKLSIIKRCWEDQLRLKHDDFLDFCDLLVACMILQKQIEHIDGKKENILVPSVAMNKLREREQAEILAREQAACKSSLTNSSNNTDAEMSTSSESNVGDGNSGESAVATEGQNNVKEEKTSAPIKSITNDSSSSNLCVLCLEEERKLACIPCGHLATCVPCGHSLRSCPICRSGIDAFVRIYV